MFNKLKVPMLGVVENMGAFCCPGCGKVSEIFSHGGAKTLAAKHNIPVLGSVPLDPTICEGAEIGKPITLSKPDSAPAKAFREIARQTAARVSVLAATKKPLEIKMTVTK
jgi:ATP-binding protein involved in chromosome partitioning